jgi:hypothetical protein
MSISLAFHQAQLLNEAGFAYLSGGARGAVDQIRAQRQKRPFLSALTPKYPVRQGGMKCDRKAAPGQAAHGDIDAAAGGSVGR